MTLNDINRAIQESTTRPLLICLSGDDSRLLYNEIFSLNEKYEGPHPLMIQGCPVAFTDLERSSIVAEAGWHGPEIQMLCSYAC